MLVEEITTASQRLCCLRRRQRQPQRSGSRVRFSYCSSFLAVALISCAGSDFSVSRARARVSDPPLACVNAGSRAVMGLSIPGLARFICSCVQHCAAELTAWSHSRRHWGAGAEARFPTLLPQLRRQCRCGRAGEPNAAVLPSVSRRPRPDPAADASKSRQRRTTIVCAARSPSR